MEEVLPSIRKTGSYITPQKLDELLADPTSAEQLFLELQQINEKLDDMTPKGRLYLMKRTNKRLAITRASEPPSPDG